nr:hypothetical protein Q903MT_gene1333 [Picea sitchensis]
MISTSRSTGHYTIGLASLDMKKKPFASDHQIRKDRSSCLESMDITRCDKEGWIYGLMD